MNNQFSQEGNTRGFIILSQAWYANSTLSRQERADGVDEITLTLCAPDGTLSGEMLLRWEISDGRTVPYLRVFHESWRALASFSDLLAKLANFSDARQPTVDQVAAVLKSCGFKDMTERRNPRDKASVPDIRALARVLQVYLDGINQLRELGRLSSGVPTWASEAEFGKRPTREDGISLNLIEDLHELGQNAVRKRNGLRTRLARLDDQKLLAEYAHLTEDPSAR